MKKYSAVDIIDCNKDNPYDLDMLVEVELCILSQKNESTSKLSEEELQERKNKTFHLVRETLSRIGVPIYVNDGKNRLIQTAHILRKRGKYFICHYKTMFILDGKENTMTVNDIRRQNSIIDFLVDWGMIKVKNPEMIELKNIPKSKKDYIKILKTNELENWQLESKYTIGGDNRNED